MPRKRNETNAQWMERLRQYREDAESGLLMRRTQAAVAYFDTDRGAKEEIKLIAFMAIFHPEYDLLTGAEAHQMLRKDAE